MRQIEDIIGTHDARHILILCTDGGVLYQSNPNFASDDLDTPQAPLSEDLTSLGSSVASESSDAASAASSSAEGDASAIAASDSLAHGLLVEFMGLQRDPERERVWALKRVGRRGEVVLLRAIKPTPNSSESIAISIRLLSGAQSSLIFPMLTRAKIYHLHTNQFNCVAIAFRIHLLIKSIVLHQILNKNNLSAW